MDELVQAVQFCVSLGDLEVFFLVCRQVDDLVILVGNKGLHVDDCALGHLFQRVNFVGADCSTLTNNSLAFCIQNGFCDRATLEFVRVIGKGFEHLPVWRFNESVWVNPGERRQ